jgi:hypothetical protein
VAQSPSYLLFFDWARSNLSPQAMATIREAAAAHKATGSARIADVGNTDTSGSTGYNMALSIRRADAVRNALIQNGVPAAAIDSSGRGETNLLVQTADGVREPQNRRVELAGLQGVTQVNMEIFKDPRRYCQALMDKWRQYRNSQLEDALISAQMPLPAPGSRWPGRAIRGAERLQIRMAGRTARHPSARRPQRAICQKER